MAKSQYKQKILEKMRILNAELKLLSDILNEVQEEKDDGNSSVDNG